MSLALHSYAPPMADMPPAKERVHATVEEVETVQTQHHRKTNTTAARNGDKGYYRNEELGGPIHTEREMRVVVIGAGVSGLCFAYKIQRSFETFSLQLYEKNPEISGTWYENRYPGCACDVPSHNYVFSWEQNPSWSSVYAGSAEIKEYYKSFASKHQLNRYVRLNSKVSDAAWDDTNGRWSLKIEDGETGETFTDSCDILINGSGILNNWQWPAIDGLDTFQGTLLHSANYDRATDLKGKRVGLIGNGSSGIQILPAVQQEAASVTTFIRTATWVTPLQGFDQHTYTSQEKAEFENNPQKLLDWRKETESNVNNIYSMFLNGSRLQESTKKRVTLQMEQRLHKPDLRELLVPKWDFGCRRMTPGINYLETLQADNVTVVTGQVEKITPSGCVANGGKEYLVDVLICATGFDVSFRPRFSIKGKHGQDLRDIWSGEAHSYLGVGAPSQPNYFHFLGPNCPIGSGPLVGAIEAQADYMLRWCDRWQTEKMHSFTPKLAAIEDFASRTDFFMRDTIWKAGCRSWYKSHTIDGRVSALWPGSSLHYFEAMGYLRAEDFDIEYKGNRFDFLGNGFSQTELDMTADWAYYIRDGDDSPFLSKSKQRKVLTKSGTQHHAEPILDENDPNWKAWC